MKTKNKSVCYIIILQSINSDHNASLELLFCSSTKTNCRGMTIQRELCPSQNLEPHLTSSESQIQILFRWWNVSLYQGIGDKIKHGLMSGPNADIMLQKYC